MGKVSRRGDDAKWCRNRNAANLMAKMANIRMDKWGSEVATNRPVCYYCEQRGDVDRWERRERFEYFILFFWVSAKNLQKLEFSDGHDEEILVDQDYVEKCTEYRFICVQTQLCATQVKLLIVSECFFCWRPFTGVKGSPIIFRRAIISMANIARNCTRWFGLWNIINVPSVSWVSDLLRFKYKCFAVEEKTYRNGELQMLYSPSGRTGERDCVWNSDCVVWHIMHIANCEWLLPN